MRCWVVACAALINLGACSLSTVRAQDPHLAFMQALRQHCGQAYAGRIEVNQPPDPKDPFAGKILLMHIRECSEAGLRIPFHVGDDRSRTWVLTRTETGLRLKHDHRHADGSEDLLTQYGGDTLDSGTSVRQTFPADAHSRDLFLAQGRAISVSNVWALEMDGHRFVYELARPDGRKFRVEFDLDRPVPPPPAPWGAHTL